jgi:hypothetical protein
MVLSLPGWPIWLCKLSRICFLKQDGTTNCKIFSVLFTISLYNKPSLTINLFKCLDIVKWPLLHIKFVLGKHLSIVALNQRPTIGSSRWLFPNCRNSICAIACHGCVQSIMSNEVAGYVSTPGTGNIELWFVTAVIVLLIVVYLFMRITCPALSSNENAVFLTNCVCSFS